MDTFSLWKNEKVLGVDGGDGCTTLWTCLMPPNCILKNAQNDKFYVYLITVFKLRGKISHSPTWIAYACSCSSPSPGECPLGSNYSCSFLCAKLLVPPFRLRCRSALALLHCPSTTRNHFRIEASLFVAPVELAQALRPHSSGLRASFGLWHWSICWVTYSALWDLFIDLYVWFISLTSQRGSHTVS